MRWSWVRRVVSPDGHAGPSGGLTDCHRGTPGRAGGTAHGADAIRDLHGRGRHAGSHDGSPAERTRTHQGHRCHRQEGRRRGSGRFRDRRAPQPPVRAVLSDHAAGLYRRPDATAPALDLDHAHHHQRSGQDRRGLRGPAAPRRRPGRPDAGPRQHRARVPVVRPGCAGGDSLDRRALRTPAGGVGSGGRQLEWEVPHPAAGVHAGTPAAGRHTPLRMARLHPFPGDHRTRRLLWRRVLRESHLLAGVAYRGNGRPLSRTVRALRARNARAGHRRARRAGVHAPQQPRRDPRVPALLR